MASFPPLHLPHALEREIVQRQVNRKRNQLMKEQRHERHNWRIFNQVKERDSPERIRGPRGEELVLEVRHERNVAREIVSILMVGLVREAPGVIGHQ